MIKNGVYFIVIALLVAELFKILISIVLNIFTNNEAKTIYCNLQCCIFVYTICLMETQGINPCWHLKESFGD